MLSGVGDRRKQFREMLGDRKTMRQLTGYFGEIISPERQVEYSTKEEKRKRGKDKKRRRVDVQKEQKKKPPRCRWYVRLGGLVVWVPGTGDFDAVNDTRLIREGKIQGISYWIVNTFYYILSYLVIVLSLIDSMYTVCTPYSMLC